MQRHSAVVLGASGLVAQRMQQRLANHPWFELTAVVGSRRTAGRTLDSLDWNLPEKKPVLPNLTVLDAADDALVKQLKDVGISVAFSCIPASVADPLELALASSGIAVFSNASAFRRCDGIPLVISDVNSDHLEHFGGSGYALACATNCTLIPLAVPAAALARTFGIRNVKMNSEQALSGAGYELVLDAQALNGNHSPEIPGEAEKTASELLHVLGTGVNTQRNEVCPMGIHRNHQSITESTSHQIFVSIQLEHPTTIDNVLACLENWNPTETVGKCPSAPHRSLHIVEQIDVEEHLWSNGLEFQSQPDPSTDLKAGMAIVIGSVRMTSPTNVEFSAYSHNTVRGAAGGTMWLAEQAYIQNKLSNHQQA
jgi:aspartate-semialdehyde dehydrogenase